ncbi:MAG: ACP phosphodiesterase [Microscillaceae bacterium]|nr:ACP phosphodiesterase [Microscillaceae bacterium]
MNLLAHAYLSGKSKNILIGNFIADFIKGNKFRHYSEEIIQGIHLHRKIDEYTDHHPVVKESISHLRPQFNRYAGVIVDIFYDHFLAVNFNTYSDLTLADFSKDTYEILESEKEILPEKVQEFLPYMIGQNWFVRYADLEGIERSLKGLSRRSKFVDNLESSVQALEFYYDDFDREFNRFFPELMVFVQNQLDI